MIRVRILADSPERRRRIAELLAEDERIDVLDGLAPSSFADVTIAAGISVQTVSSGSNVVFLTEEEPVLFEAYGRAWLSPDITAEELTAAVLATAQDFTILTEKQARKRLPAANHDDEGPGDFLLERLTTRELQVLRMLADGRGNKEIAGELGISDHTAKFHVSQILAKLGAGSRTEAVMIGIRRGLVPI